MNLGLPGPPNRPVGGIIPRAYRHLLEDGDGVSASVHGHSRQAPGRTGNSGQCRRSTPTSARPYGVPHATVDEPNHDRCSVVAESQLGLPLTIHAGRSDGDRCTPAPRQIAAQRNHSSGQDSRRALYCNRLTARIHSQIVPAIAGGRVRDGLRGSKSAGCIPRYGFQSARDRTRVGDLFPNQGWLGCVRRSQCWANRSWKRSHRRWSRWLSYCPSDRPRKTLPGLRSECRCWWYESSRSQARRRWGRRQCFPSRLRSYPTTTG